MLGHLEGNMIVFERADELYDRGFGERIKNKLNLNLFEGVYLVKTGKIDVKGRSGVVSLEHLFEIASDVYPGFEIQYAVFEDLLNRGVKARYSKEGYFLVYPRGVKRGGNPDSIIVCFSDNEFIEMDRVERYLAEASNLGVKLIIAVVDQEWEVTYYQTGEIDLRGEMGAVLGKKVKGKVIGERVIAGKDGRWLYTKFFFGNWNDILELSKIEAKYLQEKNILELDGDINLNTREMILYRVYKMCRDRGLVVKTGFKFGSDFRGYIKVDNVENLGHSEYLINVLKKEDKLYLRDMACSVRLAHNVRKKMVYAVVDENLRFIEIVRVRI